MYTVYVKNIRFCPAFMKFKWDGGFFICNGVGFKLSKNISIWKHISYRVCGIVPMFVRHDKNCEGFGVLLGC
jgi:hypothetical protein